MSAATLITVAPTGAELSKTEVPALPVTLDEVVTTARECEALGASVIHVHVRDHGALPSLDPVLVRETVLALREQTSLIVQLSSGGTVHDPEADRLRVLDAGPDMASCTMGTVNFGEDVFLNRWEFIVELHLRMQERAIVPEYEIYDLGQLVSLRRLLDRYGPPAGGHVHVDLIMGVPGGMPGTAEALIACLRELPEGGTFSATGVGRTTLPVLMAALSTGGHLRVGLEDTINYAKGQPVESNMQLVARAAGFARLAQRPPLSTRAARQFLGLLPPPEPVGVPSVVPDRPGAWDRSTADHAVTGLAVASASAVASDATNAATHAAAAGTWMRAAGGDDERG